MKTSSLGVVRQVSKDSVTVPLIGWEEIDILVPAKLSIISNVEGKNTIHKAQLTFRTCEDLNGNEHYAYLVSTADGKRYLLGRKERPYPVLTVSDTMPDNFNDSQLKEYTVTYSSAVRIPKIADI